MRHWIVLLALAQAAGCTFSEFGRDRSQFTTLSAAVLQVALTAESGNVTIEVQEGAPEATIWRTVRWNGDAPCLESSLEDGLLTLADDCRDGLACAVDYEIVLPASPDLVTLDTGSGDLLVSGVTGDVDATTGSGDILLMEIGGEILVEAGSGDIEATGITGTRFTGSTGSGDFELDLEVAPEAVDVETGSGDVMITLPGGTYAIDTSTGSGDVTLTGVRDGEGGTLHVQTGSGDIDIHGR